MTIFSSYKTFIGKCKPSDFHVSAKSKKELLIPQASDSKLVTYYSPFDYTNADAKLVIIGITPGRTQMNAANQAACLAIRAGMPDQDTLLKAKKSASFGGDMQETLIELLNHSGINNRLGIATCKSLWAQDNWLVHFTSALRNPVFVLNGSEEVNYTGGSPTLSTYRGFREPLLRLKAELLSINTKAVILPLGAKVVEAIQALVNSGALPLSRVLNADGKVAEFAHPSGQNAETVKLARMKEPMSKTDYAQQKLREFVAKKTSEGTVVTREQQVSYLKTRESYWNRDSHTRKAISML